MKTRTVVSILILVLAVMIVVDSREVTRNKNPDMVKDC